MFDPVTGVMLEGIGALPLPAVRWGSGASSCAATTRTPAAFDEGLLEAMARRFSPGADAWSTRSGSCRSKGGPHEAASLRRQPGRERGASRGPAQSFSNSESSSRFLKSSAVRPSSWASSEPVPSAMRCGGLLPRLGALVDLHLDELVVVQRLRHGARDALGDAGLADDDHGLQVVALARRARRCFPVSGTCFSSSMGAPRRPRGGRTLLLLGRHADLSLRVDVIWLKLHGPLEVLQGARTRRPASWR